ncbi:hypothetical protein TIFTF001_024279 [Ficus carica]|uniref:Uncharacterized protein n=1 Tax=Ficus carica TaxID=3494 RepID=A0AA88DKC3_FICCA|nr:hypothetical protein TIFTF001_024279 [Ficus carica]
MASTKKMTSQHLPKEPQPNCSELGEYCDLANLCCGTLKCDRNRGESPIARELVRTSDALELASPAFPIAVGAPHAIGQFGRIHVKLAPPCRKRSIWAKMGNWYHFRV